jgi:uncharacterized RDD family membrane protein YckC
MISEASLGIRAGFWRRLFALAIDSIIISVLFQAIAVLLFAATAGQSQIHGDLAYTKCVKLEKVPEGLAPPPSAGANVARECDVYFLWAQTARILQIGHVAKEEADGKTRAQTYMLDKEGHPVDSMPLDWLVVPALLAYLITMEARAGATLGSRALGIRVVDVARPAGRTVPLRRVVMRYLAMLIGLLPALIILFVYVGLYGSPDGRHMLFASLSGWEPLMSESGSRTIQWHPYLNNVPWALLADAPSSLGENEWLFDCAAILFNVWVIFLAVQIARKRDPLYDSMAGTAVLRELDGASQDDRDASRHARHA